MPQSSDIVLNGDPYMLAPGKARGGYTRTQDGAEEGRTERVAQTDFFGGTRRPYQLENDRGWASTNAGPAYGGQSKLSTGGLCVDRTGHRVTGVPACQG